MDDEELTRLAEQEILRETKRAAERAAVYGALGWMKCPLRPTNKQFLVNTILPTLSTNKNRYNATRRNYYRTDEGTYSHGFSGCRCSPGDRYSHRPKRESDSEGTASHSHRDSKDLHKNNCERHDKNKDSSPTRKRKLSESNSLDAKSKESSSYGTENKTTDSRNNVDKCKESEYTHQKSSKDRYTASTSHKSHKDDKYSHRKINNSHHYKKHDDYVSADRYRDNEQRDYNTEVAERHTKSRIDDRLDGTNKTKLSAGLEFENYKDKRLNDDYKTSDMSSKRKHGESAIKHDKSKDEKRSHQSNKSNSFVGKEFSTVAENNNSSSEKGKHSKIISYRNDHAHQSSNGEKTKKMKTSQKIKKDKSKKIDGAHTSHSQKVKKKRCKTTESGNTLASVNEGSTVKSKREYKSEKSDVRSDEERKCYTEDKLKMQQSCGDKENGRSSQNVKYFEQSHLEEPQYRLQESKLKQAVNKESITEETVSGSNMNAKPEKKFKNVFKISVSENNSKNGNKNNGTIVNSVGQAKKSVKNNGKSSNYSKKDNKSNCCTSVNHDIKDIHTNSRSSKDIKHKHLENTHVHHREKTACLRDITDEVHQEAENSKRRKRRKWSIESD